MLKTVLGYLVLNYWEHRSGWPDLLVYRANQWFLAEVKSWSDKLNENQNRWIENNHRYLHLPFKLVQVHRMEFMSALPTDAASVGRARSRRSHDHVQDRLS